MFLLSKLISIARLSSVIRYVLTAYCDGIFLKHFITNKILMYASQVSLDDRYVELQATLAKVEAERNLERDKYRRLKQEVSDERSTSSNAEAHAQVLHTQVLELQVSLITIKIH